MDERNRRRFTDPRAAAEAAFRKATGAGPAPAAAPAARAVPPGARETVSLRLDSGVLAHFQKDGPGWQDRINEALKAFVGRDAG